MPLSDCSQSGMDMRWVFCDTTGTNAMANVSTTVFQNPPTSWPRWCLRCGTVRSKLRWQRKSHKLDDMSFAQVLQNVQDSCLVPCCIELVLSHGILFPQHSHPTVSHQQIGRLSEKKEEDDSMSHFIKKCSDYLTESKAHCEKPTEMTEPKKKKQKTNKQPSTQEPGI